MSTNRSRSTWLRNEELALFLHLQYACTVPKVVPASAATKYRSVPQCYSEAVLRKRAQSMRYGSIRHLMDIREVFALSPEATGRLFGVSRQAVNLWRKTGVPADRRASLERIWSLTQRLARTFKKERIPEIALEPMPGLNDRSILDTIAESGVAPVIAMLDRARSYVPGP